MGAVEGATADALGATVGAALVAAAVDVDDERVNVAAGDPDDAHPVMSAATTAAMAFRIAGSLTVVSRSACRRTRCSHLHEIGRGRGG
jgi:hypothetical protein